MSDSSSKILPPPRTSSQRKADSLYRLKQDKDLLIATGDLQGNPCMVPLSFWWDGSSLFVATVKKNPTAQNLILTKKARVILGNTRDVILIDTNTEILEPQEVSGEQGNAYNTKCGWDPREEKGYRFFRLTPVRIEVWRELNEHSDRELMRDGNWLI
jgi:hypothetical protein